ncbi:O-succinylbenzoic acid--CoA ligase [Arthrobacter sp. V4I6]|nr:O-succinylbenzoic acid--CoA ligase [Arthrobacter sp. V4I6]
MTSPAGKIEPALAALAAALRGEGPAVELSAGPDGTPVVARVETPGFEDAAVVVRTSGSTGTPKATVLTVDALAASSMATALALKGEGQWLLALPVQYVAGLQVLVRSLFAGTRPWVLDLSGGFTPEAFTAAALELTDKIRFTSLVPTQLQRLLDSPSADTLAVLRRFNAVLVGGAPAAPELLASAREAGVRVVTTYGSAETCGGCVYDGVPLDGVEVRLADDGRILLGGATVAAGYVDAPELTAEAFAEDDGVRWYRTSDLGELASDGSLAVLGPGRRRRHHRRREGVRRARAGGAGEARRRAGRLRGRRSLRRVGPVPCRLCGTGRQLPGEYCGLHRGRCLGTAAG